MAKDYFINNHINLHTIEEIKNDDTVNTRFSH